MKLPPFSEFSKSVDFEKMGYDMQRFSPQALRNSSSLFTQDQYTFMCQTMATMNQAMLQQYHQWLAEQLEL